MAEICHYFFPKIVDLHNYRHARRRGGEGPAPRLSRALTPRLPSLLSPASSATGRHYNWTTLQARVLAKLGVPATAGDVAAAADAAPGAAEWVLALVRRRAGGPAPAAPRWEGRVVERAGWRTAALAARVAPASPAPGAPPSPSPLPASTEAAALKAQIHALERAVLVADARAEGLAAALASAELAAPAAAPAHAGRPESPGRRLLARLSPRRRSP